MRAAAPLPSRRELLLGAAAAVALAPGSAAAAGRFAEAGAPSRLTLSPGPFVAAALAGLVAGGRLGRRDPIARHLEGIEAFRPGDGAPLTVADLDAHAHGVDRFLASALIETIARRPLADHLQRALLRPLGMHETRIVGEPRVSGIDCSVADARRWLQSRVGSG